MPTLRSFRSRSILLYGLLAFFIAAQGSLTLLAPVSPQISFGISAEAVRILRVLIGIFYWSIWFLGIRSVLTIWQYADRLKQRAGDLAHRGFHRIGHGVLWLIGSLAITSVVSGMRARLGVEHFLRDDLTILLNWLYAWLPLLGIGLLYSGVRLLRRGRFLVYSERERIDNWQIAALFASVITVLYGAIVFTNLNRQPGDGVGSIPAYYIPDPLIVLTILLPSFIIWLLGILTMFKFSTFSPRDDQAHLKARRTFVMGLWMMLFSIAAIHTILALGAGRLTALGLPFLLVAVYGILLLLLLGSFRLFRGAKRMLQAAVAASAAGEAEDTQRGPKREEQQIKGIYVA